MPETAPYSQTGLVSIPPNAPVRTNSLIHKFYLHMLDLARSCINIYLLELASANRLLKPNTRPGQILRIPNDARLLWSATTGRQRS